MSGRLDAEHRARDVPITVDDERRPVDPHVVLAGELLLAPDAVLFGDRVVRVREERERQLVLRLELLMRRDVVGADAEDLSAALAEDVVRVAKLTSLGRAAGRVVLGIEVEDDRAAAQVRELDRLARIALE